MLHAENKMERNENQTDRENIRSVLARYKGNKTLTAKHLGICRATLWKKLKELGVD